MSITEQIDELLELAEKPAAAPWYEADITESGLTVVDGPRDMFGFRCEAHEAAFIISARNRTPALLRVLKCLLEEREAATAVIPFAKYGEFVEATDAAIREAEKEQV